LVKTIIETGIPKVKQYLSENNEAYRVSDIAEHLEVSNSAAFGLLDLMCVFEIVDKAKRGRTTYYFLKNLYSDEQIKAMLPPEKVPLIPGPRRHRLSKPQRIKTSFKDEYLSALEEKAGSAEGLPALAFLSSNQEETADTLTKKPPIEMVSALMGKEMKPESLIKIEPFATVKHLPKNVRRLSQAETSYLKNLLKGITGFEMVERYNTVFSKFSALENGRYGALFYFSLGSNPWDNVRRVTVDPSISDYMVLPTIEANRWISWKEFLAGLKSTRRYSRGDYDEMLDKFMESGDKLVEITVENRGTSYVRQMLKNKIMERGITDQVEASRVDEWIYLEKTG